MSVSFESPKSWISHNFVYLEKYFSAENVTNYKTALDFVEKGRERKRIKYLKEIHSRGAKMLRRDHFFFCLRKEDNDISVN